MREKWMECVGGEGENGGRWMVDDGKAGGDYRVLQSQVQSRSLCRKPGVPGTFSHDRGIRFVSRASWWFSEVPTEHGALVWGKRKATVTLVEEAPHKRGEPCGRQNMSYFSSRWNEFT